MDECSRDEGDRRGVANYNCCCLRGVGISLVARPPSG